METQWQICGARALGSEAEVPDEHKPTPTPIPATGSPTRSGRLCPSLSDSMGRRPHFRPRMIPGRRETGWAPGVGCCNRSPGWSGAGTRRTPPGWLGGHGKGQGRGGAHFRSGLHSKAGSSRGEGKSRRSLSARTTDKHKSLAALGRVLSRT